ncbi:hypothetical protein DM860_002904 [Cuscuta australis]|uniref:BRCT domain-containing protein n=1 Tax=Cuscuta australis TaxID=267555 RepID=A0A328D4M3_9ASTE|nr:hypothetical protein DM860_002904 [Cuscuta australis]
MGSLLGFRPPQFSEDGAWLPFWLQQEDCDAEASVLGIEQGQSSPEPCVEGHHNCQKHVCNISADEFLGEEGRYTNCHLYLSGDDSSLLTATQSIDNAPQYHLHLSLDCSSVGMPSPCIDAFHVERNEIYSDLHVQNPEVPEPKANNVLNAEQNIDAIACSLVPEFQRTENDMTMKELEEKSRSLKVEKMCDAVVMSCSLAPECDRAPEDQSLEGLDEDSRLVEIEQTDDAVEMSISASEALVIHEVFRTLSSELPVSSVLEAALQLKQARLEVWKDSHETSCNSLLEEEITDTEYCLGSEDIHKENVHDHLEGDNLSVSQVKDTLDSENCGQERKSELVNTSTSQYDHLQGYNLSVSQVKDTLDSESCGQDRKSKPLVVQLPDTERNLHGNDFTNRKMEVHENDHQLKQNTVGSYDCDWHNKSTMGLPSTNMSHQSNPMLHLPGQTEDHNSTEDCSLQANLESHCAKRFEIDGQHYGVSGTVSNRFQSRWFGGWSGNDTNISVPMRPNNIKIIAGHFAGETSYLSESADLAPDENSFVGPKPDEKACIASQSTIPSEGALINRNNQVLLSQDASRFSSPSYVDPLCSVVPCSIPSQNMLSRSALCDDKQVYMEKFFTPGTEHIENLQSNSNLDNKVLSEQISISEASADRPDHSVHKKLISMRSISMRPCYVSSLKNGSLGKTCLLDKSLPPPNLYGSTESVHGFPSGLQTERDSHFLSMKKGSVQHLDHFSSEFSAEANGKQIEGSQTVAEIPTHPNLLKLQLIHENQNITSSGTIKRVRFAEIETKVANGEKRLKQQITSNACHTVRASKCLRPSRSHFESRAQNKKGTLTNCQAKFVKMLFQSMKFLLTGFPKQKLKRIEDLIRKYGGTVLTDIPFGNKRKRSSRHREQALPIVLCPKKLQTMKFLYGCAVGALMVKAKWLTDSIAASSLLPPEQYMILRKSFGGSLQTEILLRGSSNYIFDGVGIMLHHGSKRNCTGIAKVIEHGGGRVLKTLQKLVLSLDAAEISLGFIVTEDGSWTSRHLKQCALEKKIPIMSVQWIVNSLHAQKLLPFTEKKDVVPLPLIKLPDTCSIGWSHEI